MSIESAALLRDLRGELKPLIDDLRTRCDSTPEVNDPLRDEWTEASTKQRTARSFNVWREDVLVDVAVAWLLAGVFVRFCEDNQLIEPQRLGGNGERLAVAQGHRTVFFQGHPGAGDREWLLHVFEQASEQPGLSEVLGHHNPLWRFGPTVDGARRIIQFWERRGDDGERSVHDFTDPVLDTRFLGDLYQDLSDSAKKQYALLQTPIFVEEFILDRTLEPAIAEFGLDDVSVIDPTCGSGHFLLGAFDRLFPRLRERHPSEGAQVTAQRALDAIVGIDLNPAAAVIARFRMLVAALKATGTKRLADLPDFHVNVAVGDSLLHGRLPGQTLGFSGDLDAVKQHAYATEDVDDAKRLLARRYHAVVGNPPYITVKDAAMNAAYRNMFRSCRGKYALSVPFFERFFDLAQIGDGESAAGFVGMITSNSFMKREMGKTLVEDFIPMWDLTHVIDTSGAYIPGHGTPTVVLFGRHQYPRTSLVRGVLGTRGEPGRPEEPSNGLVWRSIVDMSDAPGTENDFVSVVDLERSVLKRHPWSIGGGGSAELKQRFDRLEERLEEVIDVIGITAVTGEDSVYLFPSERDASRCGVDDVRPVVQGDVNRDWSIAKPGVGVWVYDEAFVPKPLDQLGGTSRFLWAYRAAISQRRRFGTPMLDKGLAWWEWQELYAEKLTSRLTITFAHVATHNHFILARSGEVFNRSAPVIKLPAGAPEDDHLGLVALLNSASAGFWMQQVFHNKGGPGGGSSKDEKWHDFFDHDGTKLKKLPMPGGHLPVAYGRRLDDLATERAALLPDARASSAVPNRAVLSSAHEDERRVRRLMIAIQEELDWHVMGLYGLLDGDYTYALEEVPPLSLGERAFEIVMARQMADGELETTWFARHGSTPITEIPSHWPEAYRQLVQRRIDKIESDRDVALIERPECKRRWNDEPWEAQQERALRGWLLDRLESADHWHGQLRTARSIAEQVKLDADFMQVAELYRGAAVDVTALVTELMSAEAVPYLAAWRYSESGLRKHAEWLTTWDLQRREDAGDDVGTIPVPPKYGKEDFAQQSYWPLRGKLDVPKERFIAYPGVHKENDPTPLFGWAGWDHLQRAQALAALITDAQGRGADTAAEVPLLAGLWELVPWLRQWHNEVDPTYGERLGDFFASFSQQQATRLQLSTDDLAAWRAPAPVKKGRGKR